MFNANMRAIAGQCAVVLFIAPLAVGPATSMPFDTNVTQLTLGGGGGNYNEASGCNSSIPVRYVDAGGDITHTQGAINYGAGAGIIARDSTAFLPAAAFSYIHPHLGLASRYLGLEIGGYAFSKHDPLGYGFGWFAPSGLLRVGQSDDSYVALQYLSRTPFASGTIADLGYGWPPEGSRMDWFVGLGMQWLAGLPKFYALDGHVDFPLNETFRMELRGNAGLIPWFGEWHGSMIDVNLGAGVMYQW